jgi:uncharacterized membrane protein
MAKKGKKILLWLLIIFVGFPILLVILGTFLTTTVSNEEGEAQQSQAITCETASQEDIENISSGMSDESYSVTSGFASTLPKSEIEKITSIFPSYTNPRIVAAQVVGVSDSSPTGLWAIQQVTDSGSLRITALNSAAREYSVWGSAANDGSAAAQLRDQLLESAESIKLTQCLD